MRIIGGKFRSKPLVTPTGTDTRPTTDRVRENLFNVLANRIDFDEIRVIDLFAGSGALGLEALSRGAGFCLFVEHAAKARAAIQKNIEALQVHGTTQIFRRDATKIGAVGTMTPFGLAFADPPYGRNLGERAASALLSGGWLSDNAIFILEEERYMIPSQLDGYDTVDVRTYGGTAFGLYQKTSTPS